MKPTADLCDERGSDARICEPIFADYGGVDSFHGPIVTLQTFEDNSGVRGILSEPGQGRVLVVDGGGALTCGLLGGNLARLAEQNGWAGLVVHGCVRDTAEIETFAVGVKALAAHPRKSRQRGEGERDVPVEFAGVAFRPGDYLVADRDGVIVLAEPPR
jgi:regulator of ribonuclease activity A